MKRISLLILMLTMVLSLTGCQENASDLYKAIEKTNAIEKLESQSSLSFTIIDQDLREQDKAMLDMLGQMLNLEDGQTKMEIKSWTSFSEDKMERKYIIKLPSLLRDLLEVEDEYLIKNSVNNFQIKDLDYNLDEIGGLRDLEIRKVPRGDLDIYQIRIEDKDFKLLLGEFANQILDSENIEFFNDFMDLIQDIEILGKNGITIEHLVNKDGYISSKNFTINIDLDLEKIGKKKQEISLANTQKILDEVLEEMQEETSKEVIDSVLDLYRVDSDLKGNLKIRLNVKTKNTQDAKGEIPWTIDQ